MRLQLGIRTEGTPPGSETDAVTYAAVGTLATAMGAVTAKAKQPPQLASGEFAHALIGGVYMALNPGSVYDLSIADLIGSLKKFKNKPVPDNDLLVNIDKRPDIVDLPKLQVYEIKSFGSRFDALPEMHDYIRLLESFGIPGVEFSTGSPANKGASGVLPYTDQGESGVLVWGCPWPGAILYSLMKPDFGKVHVNEQAVETERARLNAGQSQIVGVEAMTAASLVVAMVAVEGFPALLGVLGRAVTAAGQALPAVLEGAGGGGLGAPLGAH